MYNLPYHKEHDPQVIKEFIQQYPFAFVTGCDVENKPVATQVPVFFEERNGKQFLCGHIMRNTDHHKAFMHNQNVLAVFTGKNSYVSAKWYSNPHMGSTWSYMSVHIKGRLRFLEETALEEVLQKTSLHFENYDANSPTVYQNLPKEYTSRLLKAIAAFEIEVVDLDTIFKLSQDRDEKSYDMIMSKLRDQGEDGRIIASEMVKRKKLVFPG